MTTVDINRALATLADGNACAGCGEIGLQVGGGSIICPNCGKDPPLAYDPEALAVYRRDGPLTEHQRVSIERMLARIARREGVTTQDIAVRREDYSMDNKGLVTLLKAKFPRDLKEDDGSLSQFLYVADAMGLSPVLGEIVPIQGVPYPTVKGLVRKAREGGIYGGLRTRAATPDERRDQRAGEDDDLWTAIFRLKDGTEYQGWGKVTGVERAETGKYRDNEANRRYNRVGKEYAVNPVLQAKGAEMAETRAVHDAIDRAGVLYMPKRDDIVMDGLAFRVVDRSTGEIIEAPAERAALVAPHEPAWTEYPDGGPVPVEVRDAVKSHFEQAFDAEVAADAADRAGDLAAEAPALVTAETVAMLKAEAAKRRWGTADLKSDIKGAYAADRLEDLLQEQGADLMDYLAMDGKPRKD